MARAWGALIGLVAVVVGGVGFFLPEDGRPVVNELNTMPGFTSISLYPRMWAHAGLAYPDLLTTLIETALARGTGLR